MSVGEPVGKLMLLVDPAFEAAEEHAEGPPVDAVMGGWQVGDAGERGRFQPNPYYRPRSAESPFDPVDAVLRALSTGKAVSDQLIPVLRDGVLGIAVDGAGTAVLRSAPDGVPCVQVTSSFVARARSGHDGAWKDTTVDELAATLPARDVDVLLNPGTTAAMRVVADVIRTAADGKA
ncbi:hypothetical protein GCM10027598_58860 [Amycolatopsis oliviviridis]|uniref:Type VII secretion system-associated protein n=1 Tax=Amycolatopsis oliviviridis TaxID=1471590 RepID=A0ABQ3LX70_9PSEU|nr:type VII secretion system-associated protein [Amycolatopsis oliviviridis]GHH28525.1 hypothetical protein GCM10017790_59510 [Amycolatopsis oliviviridis]